MKLSFQILFLMLFHLPKIVYFELTRAKIMFTLQCHCLQSFNETTINNIEISLKLLTSKRVFSLRLFTGDESWNGITGLFAFRVFNLSAVFAKYAVSNGFGNHHPLQKQARIPLTLRKRERDLRGQTRKGKF